SESDGGFEATVTPIGSGPWVMEDYQASSRFNFLANPDYFVEGIPLVDGVEQAIIPEYANSKAQMEAGNLHSQSIQADDVIALQGAHGDWQWLGEVTGGVGYMYFSSAAMDPDAPWRDERFRQAVSMGINRAESMDLSYNTEALKEAGLAPSEKWNNSVSVSLGLWWLDPESPEAGESARYFQYDVAEATKLLEAAGGAGAPIKWQYAGTRYGPTFDRYAEALGNWLVELGLAVEVEVQDYASVYFPQTRAGNFHGAALGITPAYPEVSGFVDRYFSSSDSNASMIDDPEINDLRARQALEFDVEARRELIHEIQRINATQMYYLPTPLGGGTSYVAYHPAARGIRRTRGYGSPSEVYPYLWLDT
ncbi:MAG: hypothetical protein GEU80_04405, partial [Dehalococcoidia bacterium]|nr:hypothetical protein [Dehalococcoidia bacterium]